MIERTFTIVNRLGLHARAAAQLVQTATKFKADILVGKDDLEVNGKSIMGILMLAAPKGSVIRISINGEDEAEAMETLGGLIEDGFGED
ncbi:phosphocarrier protein [Geothermobacter ehrlichii]|uniref:Phosphocarrier protein n=1 Tax=Geothermobacter ehrlichii TaxID=213224 RepID=A0A5D3WN78_9BACT|nr:HPr family phosphocarrier protein [Geothermobacter ehrlichii]TYO99518.1 phosphocarrier protein [Geothermobacter ehrlichii]